MTVSEILARVDVVGDPLLREAVAAGDGMILSLPHMGNWDHAGAWLTGTGVPFTTVAERLEPESLFARFVAFRESLGMEEVIPLTGGEAPLYFDPRRPASEWGEFCVCSVTGTSPRAGSRLASSAPAARMPAGPAALAYDTGAVLLPVTLSYPDRSAALGPAHPTSGSSSRPRAAATRRSGP